MKRWVAAAALAVAAVAHAGPWAPPGDSRLRSDVELLRTHGFILGPVNAWPLPWAQIDRGLERAEAAGPLPPHLLLAVRRVRNLSDYEHQRSRYMVRAAATNQPALVRGFEWTARNPGEVSVLASHDRGALHVTWGGTWVSNGVDGQRATQHLNGFRPDGSYLALKVGQNWAAYAGWIDTWWGPGTDGAMLFSTSARPFPRVGFRRLEPFTIDAPVLRWLGPTTMDMFVGQLREDRDYDNPMMIGMRFAFQPTPWFEIGLNRGLMLCGKGRPCDLKTIGRALIGLSDFDNTGTLEEPGNQVAGFDMSYRRPIGKTGYVLKLTFDTTAEDADNILIEQFARQVGVGVSGPVGRHGAMIDMGVEYVDSLASKFLGSLMGGQTWPASTYNHFIYTDGWTYGRRPLGHSLDGDTRALTFHAALTDTRNRRWHVEARHIDLNLYADPRYRLSHSNEKIGDFAAGVNWPTAVGDLRAEARLQLNAPDTPTTSPTLVAAELGWTTRF